MKRSALVTIIDASYVEQAKQLFSSIMQNGSWQGDFVVLCTTLPAETKEWFASKKILIFERSYLYNEQQWRRVLPANVLSPLMSLKYYLFTKEFSAWDNILYLDADIIVRGNLEPLASVEGFWAVRDVENPTLLTQLVRFPNQHQLSTYAAFSREFSVNAPAFNAGVLAFCTQKTQGIFEKLQMLFKQYGELAYFSEQTLLNMCLSRQWHPLAYTYNCNIQRILRHFPIPSTWLFPDVLHFNGRQKPWQRENAYFAEWQKNLEWIEAIPLSKPSTYQRQRRAEALYMRLCAHLLLWKGYLLHYLQRCIYVVSRYLTR